VKNLIKRLEELLELNEIKLSLLQIGLLENYVHNLLHFNKQINLISKNDEKYIYERHIIPCLIFSRLFENFDQSVLDIGTGGGMPGLIFAIYHQKSLSTLIDSKNKKIRVVRTIVQKIGLDNVLAIWTRAEDPMFINQYKKSFNLILSRATADLMTLIKYSTPLVKDIKSKLAVMKGGDELEEEIDLAKKHFGYIAIKKVPLSYLPENPNNCNKKFAVIVENLDEG